MSRYLRIKEPTQSEMIQHNSMPLQAIDRPLRPNSTFVECDAMVLTDETGRINGWNLPAVSSFGWTADYAIGRLFQEIGLPDRHRLVFQSLLDELTECGPTSGQRAELMLQGLHRDDYEFPIEVIVFRVETPRGINFSVLVRHFWRSQLCKIASDRAAIAFRTQEGVLITDSNFVVVDANDSYSRITGFDKQDVLGKKSPIFRSHLHAPGCFQMMMLSLVSKRHWQGEVLDRRKCGQYYRVLLRVNSVTGTNGEVANYVASFTECSDGECPQKNAPNLAFFDSLTKLPNRQLMLERLGHCQSWTQIEEAAVLMLDLDNFKILNETLGYEIGDLLLMQVAHRLTECLSANDTLARVGGDEFVVIVGGDCSGSNASQARATAEKVQRIFEQPFQLAGQVFQASASIGIGLSEGGTSERTTLLRHAETAVIRAKKSGGSCICFFDFKLQAELEARQLMIEMMREGFPHQFELHLQVQVNRLGIPFGAEALLRWNHPEHGPISPGAFIPLAEESGLIYPLGAWVLEEACKLLSRWSDDPTLSHLQLSVNVSAKEFSRTDFSQRVVSVLDRTGANASLLEIELTESSMVNDVDDVIAKILVLKERGVSFSIDDFGTGYSSLSYLKRLPLNRLKIDQSFVKGIADDHHDAAIVRAVITVARSLGIDVIAEGVESDLQRALLEEDGCHHFQGYLFGKPLPITSFEAMPVFQSTSVKEDL